VRAIARRAQLPGSGARQLPRPAERRLGLRYQHVLQKAENACSYLQPSGGTQTAAQFAGLLARQLKFAACMRSHGVPGFPDPTSSGQSISYTIPGSVRESPQFATAARDCQKLGGLMAGRLLNAPPWLRSP
jgi:hypothetical protein